MNNNKTVISAIRAVPGRPRGGAWPTPALILSGLPRWPTDLGVHERILIDPLSLPGL